MKTLVYHRRYIDFSFKRKPWKISDEKDFFFKENINNKNLSQKKKNQTFEDVDKVYHTNI